MLPFDVKKSQRDPILRFFQNPFSDYIIVASIISGLEVEQQIFRQIIG